MLGVENYLRSFLGPSDLLSSFACSEIRVSTYDLNNSPMYFTFLLYMYVCMRVRLNIDKHVLQ